MFINHTNKEYISFYFYKWYQITDRRNGLIGFRGAAPTIQTLEVSPGDDFDLLLTKHPYEYFKKKEFARVPLIAGATKNEGSYVLGSK